MAVRVAILICYQNFMQTTSPEPKVIETCGFHHLYAIRDATFPRNSADFGLARTNFNIALMWKSKKNKKIFYFFL